MSRLPPLFTLLMLLMCAAGVVHATRWQRPTLIVLGDSVSDNGNTFRATSSINSPMPGAGYASGRFSNGPVWNDYIATDTGIDIVNTAFIEAHACTVTGVPAPGLPNVAVPHLAQQVEALFSRKNNISANNAAFIWIGDKDVIGLVQGVLGGQLNASQAIGAVAGINACIKSSAERLLGLRGGLTKSLTIATVQDSAIKPVFQRVFEAFQVPAEMRPVVLGLVSTLTRQLNNGILRDVADLACSFRRSRVATFDMSGLYYRLASTGPTLGLTNVSDACLSYEPWSNLAGSPENTVVSTCPQPGASLFWDNSHITTAAQRLVADEVLAHLRAMTTLFPGQCTL